MDLSIVIVNFNTKKLLQNCLESVFASSTVYKFEVFVTDNGSTDGSLEMIRQEFPQVKLIENGINLGFSKGNNIAIKDATARYILLLNSDTTIQINTLELSIKYMDEHQDVGVMGGKVLLPTGELDKATRRKFPNPANSSLSLFGLKKYSDYNISGDINIEMEIDATTGAYMLVRKSVIDKVGQLDEEFFMYGEDLDWCWRIKSAGYKIVYYPKVEIMHYKYGSSQHRVRSQTIKAFHDAMRIFYRKHYASNYNVFFNQLVYLGIEMRKYFVMFLNRFKSKTKVN